MKTLAAIVAAGAILFAPAPAEPHAATHNPVCHIRYRWQQHHGYLEIRLLRDSCKPTLLRIRAVEICTFSGFRAGNWIDRRRQLTSIICPAEQGVSDFGYDWQYNWPKGSKHRGHVHYHSLD